MFNQTFLKDTAERAVKTFAQSMVAVMTAGATGVLDVDWVNACNEFGVVGLQRKWKNKAYSPQFKLNAVNLYLTSELSQREVANQLGVSNCSVVPCWVHEFRQNGAAAFSSKSRERP